MDRCLCDFTGRQVLHFALKILWPSATVYAIFIWLPAHIQGTKYPASGDHKKIDTSEQSFRNIVALGHITLS